MEIINFKSKFNIDGTGTLTIYPNDEDKPMILIIPGGGYDHLSTREAIPVSNKFLDLGYNTAILRYSVSPFSFPTQLDEANASIEFLLSKYSKLFIIGFSAGGHLAGLSGTDKFQNRISGLIFSYPVVTLLDDYTHKGSQCNLLKNMNNLENKIKYSIQNRITKDTAPSFIWCTKEDKTVPYENSLLLEEALKKHNVKSKLIVFPKGPHGMALADDTATIDGHEDCKNETVAKWPYLVDEFIKEVLSNE